MLPHVSQESDGSWQATLNTLIQSMIGRKEGDGGFIVDRSLI